MADRLDGHEFGLTLGVGDGQGGLACCDSWGGKESDTNEWLNWTDWLRDGLSCPTRDQIHVPCIKKQIPNDWTTREIPESVFLVQSQYSIMIKYNNQLNTVLLNAIIYFNNKLNT